MINFNMQKTNGQAAITLSHLLQPERTRQKTNLKFLFHEREGKYKFVSDGQGCYPLMEEMVWFLSIGTRCKPAILSFCLKTMVIW